MTDSLQSKEIARAGTAPANSQKEFEEFYERLDVDTDLTSAKRGWQACNARWEQKLDENELAKVLAKAEGCNVASVHKLKEARAIIEYLKGSE